MATANAFFSAYLSTTPKITYNDNNDSIHVREVTASMGLNYINVLFTICYHPLLFLTYVQGIGKNISYQFL